MRGWTEWPYTMQGDDERHRRIDHLFSVDRLNFTNLRGGLIKGWWRNAESGEKERRKEPGIRGRKGRAGRRNSRTTKCNYRHLSAGYHDPSRLYLPSSGWRSFCTGCVTYEACHLLRDRTSFRRVSASRKICHKFVF